MELKTKLNLGDKMFVVREYSKQVKHTCKYCNGTGKIHVLDKDFECNECLGDGFKIEYEAKKYNVDNSVEGFFDQYIVGEINIEVSKKRKNSVNTDIKITYSPQGMGNYFYEEFVFGSEKEAQDECDRLNSKLQGDD